MNIRDCIGKRCLLSVKESRYTPSQVSEFKIVEVSPSGNWVKLQNIYGNKFWSNTQTVSLVEELIQFEASPKE